MHKDSFACAGKVRVYNSIQTIYETINFVLRPSGFKLTNKAHFYNTIKTIFILFVIEFQQQKLP